MMIWIKSAFLLEGKGFFAFSCHYAILAGRTRSYRNQEACHEEAAHRVQTFSEIIENNYVYVDKTGIAAELIDRYKYVFLSRPQRFGETVALIT